MKVITSYGGPFVVLDSDCVKAWSGIDGKRFIGDASPHPNDYEAGGFMTNGRVHAPCNVTKIDGETCSALLISLGYDLFLMRADDAAIYMFQIEYAEADWLESSLSTKDFDHASFDLDPIVSLNVPTGKLYVFDSVGPVEQFSENRLEIDLTPGLYKLQTAIYQPDARAQVFLHKLVRDGDFESVTP